MHIRSRQQAPAEGWFQIGDPAGDLDRPRRGAGRVQLADDAGEPGDTVRQPSAPLLERANTAAENVFGCVTGVRYGALGLCALVALLVVLVVAGRVSEQAHNQTAATAAQVHHAQRQVSQLTAELRVARLTDARRAARSAQRTAAEARHRRPLARPKPHHGKSRPKGARAK